MTAICCPFDSTSRIPGTSMGAEMAFSMLGSSGIEAKLIELNSKNSSIFCNTLYNQVKRSLPKLIIGGEHLVSFPVLEYYITNECLRKIIVFDAHHDCYNYPLLTHYSLFYFLKKEFEVDILFVGARFEIEKANMPIDFVELNNFSHLESSYNKINNFVKDEKFYLSFDIDVIDPSYFRSVSDTIKDGPSLSDTLSILDFVLSKKPHACDLVEYNPLVSGFDEKDIKTFQTILNRFSKYASEK